MRSHWVASPQASPPRCAQKTLGCHFVFSPNPIEYLLPRRCLPPLALYGPAAPPLHPNTHIRAPAHHPPPVGSRRRAARPLIKVARPGPLRVLVLHSRLPILEPAIVVDALGGAGLCRAQHRDRHCHVVAAAARQSLRHKALRQGGGGHGRGTGGWGQQAGGSRPGAAAKGVARGGVPAQGSRPRPSGRGAASAQKYIGVAPTSPLPVLRATGRAPLGSRQPVQNSHPFVTTSSFSCLCAHGRVLDRVLHHRHRPRRRQRLPQPVAGDQEERITGAQRQLSGLGGRAHALRLEVGVAHSPAARAREGRQDEQQLAGGCIH